MNEESSEAELQAKTEEEGEKITEGNKYLSEETYPEVKNKKDACLIAVDDMKVESETNNQNEWPFLEEKRDLKYKTNKSSSDVQIPNKEDICTSEINSVYIN